MIFNKKASLSRILALVLALTMAFAPVSYVSAATTTAVAKAETKTVTKAGTIFQTKGILGKFNYYGKDVFEITYNPTKKTISKVKTYAMIKNPSKKYPIIVRKSITRRKISKKKWEFTTLWGLDFTKLPSAFVKAVVKKVPILEAIMKIGEFVVFQAVYEVKGNGKVTRTSFRLKLMIPKDEETLISAARTLYNLFLGK